MTEYVSLNSDIIPSEQALISVHDAGLLHGVGLFETMRSYRGTVFRLEDHLDRLFGSAGALGIDFGYDRDTVRTAIAELLSANKLTDSRVRLTITQGDIRRADANSDKPNGTLIVTATAIQPYPDEYYKNGMMAIVSSYKQNPLEPTAGHKTLGYLPRLLALKEAQQKQAGEALWFTTTNRLAEGCISNVFIVQNGILLSPPLDTPVLDGITRRVVLALAEQNGIPHRQQPIVIGELLAAEEVFLTNSIMELMPICRIERHAVGKEKPGEIYQRLHRFYRETVEGQI